MFTKKVLLITQDDKTSQDIPNERETQSQHNIQQKNSATENQAMLKNAIKPKDRINERKLIIGNRCIELQDNIKEESIDKGVERVKNNDRTKSAGVLFQKSKTKQIDASNA